MRGLRKIIYCSVFSLLVLIFLSIVKFGEQGAINEFESLLLVILILGYPTLNMLSKICKDITSDRVIKAIGKMASMFKQLKSNSDDDNYK